MPKARKEYMCEMCELPIRIGDDYTYVSDEENFMERKGNYVLKPGVDFSRLHDICLELISDGWGVSPDFTDARNEAIMSVYDLPYPEPKDILSVLKGEPPEIEDKQFAESFFHWRKFYLSRKERGE